ncbi:GNAT family N-acetyltransferase [Rhizobium sp. AAP43]|uniref:GNAT family N-acetyltransferase n=1 Tax=Rhizobium sp. AAP43 TaxID=1523420 RepID=UPI001FD95F11|nr:GNAT family N-acetyltransferase [Rhizobium sp. AAP43]
MDTVEREWRRLEMDRWNSLHQGFDWCSAWIKTHDVSVVIIEARLDGEPAFILPLQIERHSLVRVARFIATSFTNFNSGLFSAAFRQRSHEFHDDMWSDLFREALALEVDLVSLSNIPIVWRGETNPLSALTSVRNQNSAFQLALGPDMETTLAPLNAKARRKKYRTQIRRLDEVGGFEHVRALTSDEKHALLDCFFRQKATRFEAAGLPNVFRAPETQAFFRMLLDLDRGGNDVPLELHAIRLKGQHEGAIASITGLSRKGDHVICQFGSIDDRLFPEASPGELLFWLVIEHSAVTGASIFDFGIGDQEYKRRWCKKETEHFDIRVPLTGIGRLAALAGTGTTRAKALIKARPAIYAFLQRLRARSAT